MRYFLAVLFPPLGVLACGKPGQFFLSLVLTLCFYFPGLIHALFVVNAFYRARETDRIVAAIRERGAA